MVERISTQHISYEAYWKGLTDGHVKQGISWGQWPWEGQMSEIRKGLQKFDGEYLVNEAG